MEHDGLEIEEAIRLKAEGLTKEVIAVSIGIALP